MVEVVATILEDEDVDPLDVDVDLMKANKVPLRKAPGNVGIVGIVITSSKSAGKNLIDLSGHNNLSLILLPWWYSSVLICSSGLFHSCIIAGGI